MMHQRREISLFLFIGIIFSLFDPALSAHDLDSNDYQYHMSINITGYAGSTALVDFPLLVRFGGHIDGFDYNTFKTNAVDLCFTAADRKTLLDHEVDEWDVGGVSLVWVKVPLIVGDYCRIYAHWGARRPTHQTYVSPSRVWSFDAGVDKPSNIPDFVPYELVYHFNEKTDDSTSHYRHASAISSPKVKKGLVGNALEFNPERRQYLQINNYKGIGEKIANNLHSPKSSSGNGEKDNAPEKNRYNQGDSPRTFSAWVYASRLNRQQGNALISWGNVSAANQRFEVCLDNELEDNHGSLRVETNGGFTLTQKSLISSPPIWRHIAIVSSSDEVHQIKHYIDGVLVRNDTPSRKPINTSATDADPDLLIGSSILRNKPRFFQGMLDEIRLESVARNADWIRACYESQMPFTLFYQFGEIEGGVADNPDEPEKNDFFWESSLVSTLDRSVRNKKLIMIFVYKDGVKNCDDMLKIIKSPEVKRILLDYYNYRITNEKAKEDSILKEAGCKYLLWPTIIIGKGVMDEDKFDRKKLKVIEQIYGLQDKDEFINLLKLSDIRNR